MPPLSYRERLRRALELPSDRNRPAPAKGAISGNLVTSGPAADPSAWREDFNRWQSENCTRREGYDDSASVRVLHLDFCNWTIAHQSVPCRYATFEALLIDAGFQLKDPMALGLVLREDLKNLRRARP